MNSQILTITDNSKGDSMSHGKRITEALLEFGKTIDPKELFPVIVPEAAEFALLNPYAFFIAISLDRGAKAEIIWTIPYDLYLELGHLAPTRIVQLTSDDLAEIFSRLPRKPRYINDAPRTLKELTELIVHDFNGEASLIWKGHTASYVNKLLQTIYGIGPGIASMAPLLIEKAHNVQFIDRPELDIKPDTNTVRVLYRLGITNDLHEKSAVSLLGLECTSKPRP